VCSVEVGLVHKTFVSDALVFEPAAGPGYRLAFKRIFGLPWTSGMTNTPTLTSSESSVASKATEHYERSGTNATMFTKAGNHRLIRQPALNGIQKAAGLRVSPALRPLLLAFLLYRIHILKHENERYFTGTRPDYAAQADARAAADPAWRQDRGSRLFQAAYC
jgi:hypothetical protein